MSGSSEVSSRGAAGRATAVMLGRASGAIAHTAPPSDCARLPRTAGRRCKGAGRVAVRPESLLLHRRLSQQVDLCASSASAAVLEPQPVHGAEPHGGGGPAATLRATSRKGKCCFLDNQAGLLRLVTSMPLCTLRAAAVGPLPMHEWRRMVRRHELGMSGGEEHGPAGARACSASWMSELSPFDSFLTCLFFLLSRWKGVYTVRATGALVESNWAVGRLRGAEDSIAARATEDARRGNQSEETPAAGIAAAQCSASMGRAGH